MRVVKILRDPFKDLAESGKLSGLLLILATVVSLALSNSTRAASYLSLWHIEIGFDFPYFFTFYISQIYYTTTLPKS